MKLSWSIDVTSEMPPFRFAVSTDASPHDWFFWRQGKRAALRYGKWKLVNMNRQTDENWEVYDLEADLRETKDLAKLDPARRADLIRFWKKTNARMAEPLFR